ncbi:MAG: hypothetical protein ACXWZL_13655 [Mycobacterium sp.]
MDRRLAAPERMHLPLGRYEFDPRTEVPDVPDELRARLRADEGWPWIVQFQEPLTLDDQKRLRGTHRLALTEYIPDSACLDLLAPAIRTKLTADELVRAIVPYEHRRTRSSR